MSSKLWRPLLVPCSVENCDELEQRKEDGEAGADLRRKENYKIAACLHPDWIG